jgi:hypothetical protein
VSLRASGSRAAPRISAVIPSRESNPRSLAPLLERTAHPGLETIVVAADSPLERTGERTGLIRVTAPAGAFNPARWANAGARRASGDFLAFLGEDVEVTEPDWLGQLLIYLGLPGAGIAAPTLSRPDGRVDASGYAIGLYDPAAPAMRGFAADGDGYYGSLSCAREVSAVGMECMLIRRSLFEELGGFEQAYSRQYHDLDLCLRAGLRGQSVVCAPEPHTVNHATQARRRSDFDVIDRALFVDRWWERLERGDPYFNPNFLREAADYTPATFGGDPLELALRETVG